MNVHLILAALLPYFCNNADKITLQIGVKIILCELVFFRKNNSYRMFRDRERSKIRIASGFPPLLFPF
ncbi:hypothetical protein [Cyclobacterium sediminis]